MAESTASDGEIYTPVSYRSTWVIADLLFRASGPLAFFPPPLARRPRHRFSHPPPPSRAPNPVEGRYSFLNPLVPAQSVPGKEAETR
jgi:hypothetical protein